MHVSVQTWQPAPPSVYCPVRVNNVHHPLQSCDAEVKIHMDTLLTGQTACSDAHIAKHRSELTAGILKQAAIIGQCSGHKMDTSSIMEMVLRTSKSLTHFQSYSVAG